MDIVKITPNVKYIYHYTKKSNVQKILNDRKIMSKDKYVFFTESLQDSIAIFEKEMMQEGRLYIDVNGVLRKREKCKKEDYCILKLPYKNDNNFYKMHFENQIKNSVYTYSITHKGAYDFENAQVIEFPKEMKLNVLSKVAIVTAIIAGITLCSHNIYAANWLDAGNYDISWYANTTLSGYQISNAKELAGLAHLVNNENKTFQGQTIEIAEDIDLTENTWETIKNIFEGTICGSHRVILNISDKKFIEGRNTNVEYYMYNLLINSTISDNIILQSSCLVKRLKEILGENITVSFNENLQENVRLSDLNMSKNDVLNITMPKYIALENEKGAKQYFSLESADTVLGVVQKYCLKNNVLYNNYVCVYNNIKLENTKLFSEYNIQSGAVIKLCEKYEVTTNVVGGNGSVTSSDNVVISGDKIKITLVPETNYELDKITVNGVEKQSNVKNNELEVVCESENLDIKVYYKEKVSNKENKDKKVVTNPETKDNILAYAVSFLVSVLGIFNVTKYANKK